MTNLNPSHYRCFDLFFLALFGGILRSSNTTAWAMAVFSKFNPSGVFAFNPMQSAGTCSSFATCPRIAAACGPILGAAKISDASTFATLYPASHARFNASRKNTAESAPFHFGSAGENKVPMSGAAMAPSKASVTACSKTSPSECPPNPLSWARAMPPILRGIPGRNSCESKP